jgi:microcystin degradation protein MlrC
MGSAAIVVTNDDAAAARRQADALGTALWEARESFVPRLLGADEAIDEALRLPGPVCLLDMGDNVGGGSPADGTVLARGLQRRGVAGSFACVRDAAAAAAAHATGLGGQLRIAVGGRDPSWRGVADAEPLVASWTVTHLSDGRFRETKPRHGGASEFDQGPTAVLATAAGLTVMVTTHRMAPFSLEQVRHVGLAPASLRLLAAKGVHAPVAAYAEVCPSFVRVDTPGVTTADAARLPYRHRRRPLFPWER